jgi:hypothetical protein
MERYSTGSYYHLGGLVALVAGHACRQRQASEALASSKGWIDRHCDTAGSRTVEVVVEMMMMMIGY